MNSSGPTGTDATGGGAEERLVMASLPEARFEDYSIRLNQAANRLVMPWCPPYNRPMPSLSVIIPCYNEHATIAQIIQRVHHNAPDAEIVVVDDGSTDGACEILRELNNAGQPYLRVVFHARNAGKGAAVRTGIEAATGQVILIQDADMSTIRATTRPCCGRLRRASATWSMARAFWAARGAP